MMDCIRRKLRGIHAATVVPMTDDGRIDEAALEGHVAAVAETPGIRGLLVNGHAGENFVLTAAEKRRVVEISRAAAPTSCLICSGVNAESSLEAAREAEAAEAAGADVLLVFPPNSWALDHDEACVDIHHAHVRDATSLPLLLYGAPIGAGRMAYSAATLARLAAEPRIVGVKEGSWEVAAYEANRRLLKGLRPDFVVLGSGDEHLLASYLVGSEGSQVSLAAVAPELVAELYDRAEAEDWVGARKVHERVYPLAGAIYRDPPGGRATARLKACLQMLGRQANAVVRPPQPPASAAERQVLMQAIAAAGLDGSKAWTASTDALELYRA
jgi:4-hydroxy-tetrahydrodipicolinate synthase